MPKKTILPLRIRKRLISTLMSNYQDSNQERSFSLKSNADFASRSTGIFRELDALEQNHETWMSQNETVENFEETTDKDVTDSDVFKKPITVKRRKRSAALSLNKKQKWTKYSLADIPLSSDATNAAVAMQFLNDLRKKREEKCVDARNQQGKIVFKKPKIRVHKKIDCSAVHFSSNPKSNSKSITSEQNCTSSQKSSSSNTINLGHLAQDDNE